MNKMSFSVINHDEMHTINGGAVGIVITGAMVIKGIGCLASGVAFGTVLGKICKGIFG